MRMVPTMIGVGLLMLLMVRTAHPTQQIHRMSHPNRRVRRAHRMPNQGLHWIWTLSNQTLLLLFMPLPGVRKRIRVLALSAPASST